MNKLFQFAALLFALILSACGGNPAPELGAFPALTKIEGDAPFDLKAPTSDSPAAFSYSSSNPAVATISANSVSIVGVGSSTITATQSASGKWGSASISAVLTVSARSCIAPATSIKGICTAPLLPGNYVAHSGLNWMPASLIKNWADANAFCTSSSINGVSGWRLPNDFELSELAKYASLNSQGWLLGKTWSAKTGTTSGSRKTVNLQDGTAVDEAESNSAYLTCVK